MLTKIARALPLLGALAITACDNFGQAMTAHTDVVARAAGHELKVDRTAAFIAPNPNIPAQPDVVLAVATLWVDYMLLATAAAQDSTLHNIPLDAITKQIVDQDIVTQLHDQVVKADTALTDAQLRTMYEQSGTGTEIKARHILLTLPPDATPAQRDSVTAQARQLRQQAMGGADFAELAKKHSKEPGADQSGGDLGYFGRTGPRRMVAPFEDAAFKMQTGQISDVVETPFGLHIIKVEDRKTASFDENKEAYRQQIKEERLTGSRQKYVNDLTEPRKIEVQPDAYAVMKDLANKPETELRGRAASRALVKYQGGAFTAGDYVQFIRAIDPRMRASIPQRPDEDLKGVLETLTRNQILVEEAKKKKLTMPPARLDSLKSGIYTQLVGITEQAGLRNIKPQEGENQDQAIERRVNSLIEATVRGQQNLIPLGPLAFALRDKFGGEIFETSFSAVVTKIEATRPPPQQQPGMPQQPPVIPPDTGRR